MLSLSASANSLWGFSDAKLRALDELCKQSLEKNSAKNKKYGIFTRNTIRLLYLLITFELSNFRGCLNLKSSDIL